MDMYRNYGMEDYWNEYKTARGRNAYQRGSHSEEEYRSHEEDVDSDEIFLDAVFANEFREEKGKNEAAIVQSSFYSTLTNRQKEQLVRRAQARNFTLRQKRLKGKERKPNIWTVFSGNDNSSTGTRSRSATPDSLDSISPPRTPPDSNSKEWIESNLSRSRASLDSGHHSLITPPSSSLTHLYPSSYQSNNSEDFNISYDPSLTKLNLSKNNHKKLVRSFSPPENINRYYYQNEDSHNKTIYRAPSLDILSKNELKSGSNKDLTVRRQRSYTRDIANDMKSHYSTKGVYDITSHLFHTQEDIQGLSYQQIGSLHYKNLQARHKIPPFEHDKLVISSRSPPTVRRAKSVKHISKDPFTPKDFIKNEMAKQNSEENLGSVRRRTGSADLGFKIISSKENEELPELVLEIGRSGQTRINWLNLADIERLTSLAILELDIIYSENGIQQSWRKKSRKKKNKEDHGVFGTSLESLLERDRQNLPDPFMEAHIPLIAHKLMTHLEMRGLKEEGILRIPGQRARTDELRKNLDKMFFISPECADEALRNAMPNELAALMKLFLRELPQPLLTSSYASAFYKVHRIKDIGERILALTMLILLLPEVHRDTLKAVLDLCSKVVRNESENKMGLYNVAMIMAPNIFLPCFQPKSKLHIKSEDKEQQLINERKYAQNTTQLTQTMIKYKEILWTVPHRLVAQVRRQYETALRASHKPIHRLLSKRHKDYIQRPITNEVDFQNGVMRISAPQFNKISHPVKLTWQMTARDIIERFLEEQSSHSENPHRVVGRREQLQRGGGGRGLRIPSTELTTCLLRGSLTHALNTHFLHEKGGNIGERRIDQHAELIAVYQDNPNGEFTIKCHHPGGYIF